MENIKDAVIVGVKSAQKQGEQILALSNRLATDSGFERAVALLANRKRRHSRVVVSGIGKSGHVGRKIAATLSSTGTTASFLHSTEAFHGDLGMISPDDILILISNSGETNEVINLIPILKRWGNKIISISGNPESTLATHADTNIDVAVDTEVCPNNLAPTSSTTATMVVGDALACALMKHVDFAAMDFAKYHPGGSLGVSLLSTVADKQWPCEKIPVVTPDASLLSVAFAMTRLRAGLAFVKTQDGEVEGIITDGDLRRGVVRMGEGFAARDVMTKSPIKAPSNTSLAAALEIMKVHGITTLLVESEDKELSIVEQSDVI